MRILMNFLFLENYYDKIFSVNTIYFWENPEFTISKIFRLLKPNGILILGLHIKDDMIKMGLDDKVFRFYSQDEVINLLSIAGKFTNVKISTKESQPKCIYCAIGRK